ncbi:hypothetical protein NUW54_g11329 [Trametes sanguinea]|uniref:Uncharacterized protein n=1 Tax=Trametes sanguinea TaxID=158606 RepID=A0ACC1NHY0_9APHY|nr:hypothetical protein NUW54_g11329 [Trametes sanguinea]
MYTRRCAYLEFFVSPELLDLLIPHIERDINITYYVINNRGDLRTNTHSDGPNAVTWGVFPGKRSSTNVCMANLACRTGAPWISCVFLPSDSWQHASRPSTTCLAVAQIGPVCQKRVELSVSAAPTGVVPLKRAQRRSRSCD